MTNPSDRSDFVTVAFVLEEPGTEDDGRFHFGEEDLLDSLDFTGVEGGFELFMPLTMGLFGVDTDLSTPLWIRTDHDAYGTEALEHVFRQMFGLDDAYNLAGDPAVKIEAPNSQTVTVYIFVIKRMAHL